jgi:elongation factor Ts
MSKLELIKQLREETGCLLSDANKALESNNMDYDKAKQFLTTVGYKQPLAWKGPHMECKDLTQGVIHSYIHHNKKIGVLLELAVQTDFAARSKEFLDLADQLAMNITASNPSTVEELLDQVDIIEAKPVKDIIAFYGGMLKEQIQVRRFVRWELGK